ncbi:18620_t:CDS:10, partial [Racocetra persica]
MGKITAQDLKDHIVKVKINDPHQEHFDKLMEAIGSARVVMIGEASHGTSDFYRERIYLTQRLITEKGFTAVCVEADYPDSMTINKYIKNIAPPTVKTPIDSLQDFKRFPLWMWRNEEMLNYIDWCRRYNDKLEAEGKGYYDKVSFYGLDLYSLNASCEAVIDYLQKVNPKAAQKARERYGIFERFGKDTMSYAFAARYGLIESAEKEVIAVLKDLCQKRGEYLLKQLKESGPIEEYQFAAESNSLVVKDAEEYYRLMLFENVKSWNLRDSHMVRTLNQILDHLTKCRNGCPAKAVIWAHNSHLGDARNTDMGMFRGEINVGQLIREQFGDRSFNVGFTTYTGTVTAAHEWNTPPELMKIVPGRKDSYEGVFHNISEDLKFPNFLIIFDKIISSSDHEESKKKIISKDLTEKLSEPLLERAIGVIYKPNTERWSHYFSAKLSKQFDAVIHLDVTRAIMPIDKFKAFKEEENVP